MSFSATDEQVQDAWTAFVDVALAHLQTQYRLRQDPGVAEDPDVRDGALAVTRAHQAARERFNDVARGSRTGFGALAANASLSPDELELLAFVLACELDVDKQRLLSFVQGDLARTRLELQTAGALLGGLDRCTRAVGPGSRLRLSALLEVSGDGPWAQQVVVPPESLVWLLLGDGSDDLDLPAGTRMLDASPGGPLEPGPAPLLLVYGPDRVRRRERAVAALGGEGFLVSPEPAGDRAWAAVVREATVTGRAVVLELEGPLAAEGQRWVHGADHLAWALTCARELPISGLPTRPFVELDAPATEVTETEWATAFPGGAVRRHRLTPQQLERVQQVLTARGGDVDAAVRRLTAGPLESLATRVRPRHGWNDLVLPPAHEALLRGIAARYRDASQVYDHWGFTASPSRGLVALFAGPSGTGKTLSAEVLAADLGLDMFRIDLSSVVSKYIGETEKNLDEVFDAAGVGNVVLFFDEADALFGRRTDVQDSNDRHANAGVSYLLQRLEAYDGVVLLATNFQQALDDAFLRRIHVTVEFGPPAQAERLALWRQHLPQAALREDLDLEGLATALELSGGQIRNAAVQAAFFASAAGGRIGRPELARASLLELRKAGRLMAPDALGEWTGS